MKREKERHDELDEFWDIPSLLPRQRQHLPSKPGATDAVDITIEPHRGSNNRENDTPTTDNTSDIPLSNIPTPDTMGKDKMGGGAAEESSNVLIKKYIPPHTPPAAGGLPVPDDEYVPGHPLIHKVKIFNWKTSYNYYEQFISHAQKLRNGRGSECPHIPYFSYVPQYSQLTRGQLNWYLWWRENAAKGNYKKTDYSYILLFIYEIINTGGHSNPEWGQRQLAGLWCAYRDDFPRFDRMLGEWLCDFSLIHHLPPPAHKSEGLPVEAVQSCNLKEFYMAAVNGSAEGYSKMLLTYCSNYDYNKSKFAKGDNLRLYDEHIRGALAETVKQFSKDGGLLSGAGLEHSSMTRDAFAGALCSYKIKKRIEIEYSSFSRSHELRFLVTDIIKYTENKIRAHLGIKSRLSVYALPTALRECINNYAAELFPKKQKDAPQQRYDYDKYYDIPATPISLDRAAEIEETSWETTERMIEAFAEETLAGGSIKSVVDEYIEKIENTEEDADKPSEVGDITKEIPIENDTNHTGTYIKGLDDTSGKDAQDLHESVGSLSEKLGEHMVFVRLALARDYAGQRRFAMERGKLPDFIADLINETAAKIIGDIILFDEGQGYSFIEEYRKEVFDE